MPKTITLLTTTLLFLIAIGSARAGLITFNQTVDVSSANGATGSFFTFDSLIGGSQSVSVGDSVALNVDFAPGQRLRMFDDDGGSERITAWLNASFGNFTITNILMSLDNLQGTLGASTSSASESSSSVHLGPFIAPTNWIATGTSVAFTGISVSFDVTALQNDPTLAGNSWLPLLADRFVVEDFSVPAPATLALFGLGLAGLGWSRRKRV